MESRQGNSFEKGLWMDSHPTLQPDGTYSYALNSIHETHEYNSFGVANEPSNELCFKLDEGFFPVGYGFIEERDSFIIFSHNEKENRSQIGIGNTKTCLYTVIVDDSKLDRKLCFSLCEKIKPQFKNLQPCNHIKVYWSNKDTYYHLDIDSDTCNLTYNDILLFKCICAPSIEAYVADNGGVDLKAGAYQFVAQLEDADTNTTNWFFISDPVYVGSENNRAGERSRNAIHLKINNLDKRYEKVNIGVITTIGGITTQRKITTEFFDGTSIEYIYRGTTGQEEEIDLSEIKDKKNGYIRGQDLIQKDGRLFLYNIKGDFNTSIQRMANNIEVEYIVSRVPFKDAEKFQNFMRDEIYALAIWPNFCDGTSGEAAHIPGRSSIPYDLEMIPKEDESNCSENCDLPRWKVENTAYRTNLFCPEAISISDRDRKTRKWVDEVKGYREINYADCGCGNDEQLKNKALCSDNPPDWTDPTDGKKLPCPKGGVRVGKVDPATGVLDPCGCVPYEEILHGGYYEEEEDEPTTQALEIGCEPKPIYSKDGCTIIGYEPTIYSIGQMAYWESEETYPLTKDCDGQYLYGSLAGKPIRHHKFPLSTLEPLHISKQNCVQTKSNPANKEDLDTFVHLMGIRVKNINFKNITFSKPLCPHNPFTIGFIKRTENNKSVIAKGLFTHTFKGYVDGAEVAIPKNGVNSLEYFDRYSEKDATMPNGRVLHKHHGGVNIDVAAYNFHSPETTFNKPPIDANKSTIELEYFGCGHRHGLYADTGYRDKPDSLRINAKGARQAINLNHYNSPRTEVPETGFCFNKVLNFLFTFTTCRQASIDDMLSEFGLSVYDNNDVKLLDPSLVREITMDIYLSGIYLTTVTETGKSSIKYDYISALTSAEFLPNIKFSLTTTEGCTYHGELNCFATSGQGGTCACDAGTYKRASNEIPPKEQYAPIYKCIDGITYADADSVIRKGNGLTYPLLNLKRESSVYLQFAGANLLLNPNNSIDRYLSDGQYNGRQVLPSALTANGTSDGSFFGDTGCHSCPITKAAAHYGSIKRENPAQYGRLESAGYISLQIGTADELLCGTIDIINGDTFIGQYTTTRTSYISNKIEINDHIHKRDDDAFIFEICDYECGEAEEGCGTMGKLRANGLRIHDRIRDVSACWDGVNTFAGNPVNAQIRPGYATNGITDAYFPAVQRTDILFFVESSINIAKRQIGDPEKWELHYKNVADRNLDSTMPSGSGWEKSYLGSFYAEMAEAAPHKKFWRSFLKILSFFIIECEALDKILGIKECLVKKCYDGNSNCEMSDDLVKGYGNNNDQLKILAWNDNYAEYNWDFSKLNDICVFRGYSDPYNTCKCIETTNVFYYSDKQNPLSRVDAYQNFSANSYSEIPAEFGKLKDLFTVNGQLYAHTTDNILNIHAREDTLNTSGGQEITIEHTQYLRTNPRELFSDIPEGYAGTIDPNASTNTQFGRIFIDQEGKKIYRFAQDGLHEISNIGVRNFLKENLDIKLLKHFPDYPCSDENLIGYKIGIDHRFNRILITKIDFEPKYPEKIEIHGRFFRDKETKAVLDFNDDSVFFDRSFTLSYNPVKQNWISFHSYYPDAYVWDRDHLYSFKDGSLWKHGDKHGDYQKFYDNYYEHIVETIMKDKNGMESDYNSIAIDFEAQQYNGVEWLRGRKNTFNGMLVYNDTQSSGELEINQKSANNQLDRIKNRDGQIDLEFVKGTARVNNLRDRVVDKDTPLFTGELKDGKRQVNTENIDKPTNNFEGKYLAVRLLLNDEERNNLQHITKRILSETAINPK